VAPAHEQRGHLGIHLDSEKPRAALQRWLDAWLKSNARM
jgi:hypothetical protein